MTANDDHDADIRYGLTALGHEALAEGVTVAPAIALDAFALPLQRIRRARSRVRALVRAAGRRS